MNHPALPAGPRGPGISSRPVWTPGKHGVPAIGGFILINSVAASIPSAGTRHPTPAGCLLRPAPGPIHPHRIIHFHYADIYGLPEHQHLPDPIRKKVDYIQ